MAEIKPNVGAEVDVWKICIPSEGDESTKINWSLQERAWFYGHRKSKRKRCTTLTETFHVQSESHMNSPDTVAWIAMLMKQFI